METIILLLFIFVITLTFVYFTIFHREKKEQTLSDRLRTTIKEVETEECKLRIVKKRKDLLTWYEIQGNRFGWGGFDGVRYPNEESAKRKVEEYKEQFQKPEQEVIYETDVDSFDDHTENEGGGAQTVNW